MYLHIFILFFRCFFLNAANSFVYLQCRALGFFSKFSYFYTFTQILLTFCAIRFIIKAREKFEGMQNERYNQNFRYSRKAGHLAQYRIQSAEREIRSRKDQDRGAERRVGTRVQKFPQDARFVRGVGKQKDPFAFHEDAHEYPLPYLRFKEHRGGTCKTEREPFEIYALVERAFRKSEKLYQQVQSGRHHVHGIFRRGPDPTGKVARSSHRIYGHRLFRRRFQLQLRHRNDGKYPFGQIVLPQTHRRGRLPFVRVRRLL